jgi:predicted RNA-binding Zn-ribbon protein involved in translation (DUF1610 family)
MQEIDKETGDTLHKCDKCGQVISRSIKGVGVIGKPYSHKCLTQ